MRGRKPKPAARQIAAGDPRKVGKKKLAAREAAEPKAATGLPPCPKHLKGLAREAWNFWCDELAIMNLDKRPHAMLLEGACMAYEAAVRAYEIISAEGPLIEIKAVDKHTGEIVVLDRKTHPAVRQRDDALKILRSFGSEFGFSPVSLTRLAVEKPDTGEADLMAILSTPRVKRSGSAVN